MSSSLILLSELQLPVGDHLLTGTAGKLEFGRLGASYIFHLVFFFAGGAEFRAL